MARGRCIRARVESDVGYALWSRRYIASANLTSAARRKTSASQTARCSFVHGHAGLILEPRQIAGRRGGLLISQTLGPTIPDPHWPQPATHAPIATFLIPLTGEILRQFVRVEML